MLKTNSSLKVISLFRTGFGVGDVLLATGILKAMHRTTGNRYIVETHYPELFLHHPGVKTIWKEGRRARLIQQLFGWPCIWRVGNPINEWFESNMIKTTYPFPCLGRHLIDAMAETVGVRLLSDERRPFIYLKENEINQYSWAKDWIAIQSSSSTYWTPNKNWIQGRMQSVVNEIKTAGYNIVHLGNKADEELKNVKDLRGIVTIRDGIAILKNCRVLICLEGGLMHSAKAAGIPAIVIYTGYTAPQETGYDDFINLRSLNAGKSCWRRDLCEHCLQSASDISIDQVLKAVHQLLPPVKGTVYSNV